MYRITNDRLYKYVVNLNDTNPKWKTPLNLLRSKIDGGMFGFAEIKAAIINGLDPLMFKVLVKCTFGEYIIHLTPHHQISVQLGRMEG